MTAGGGEPAPGEWWAPAPVLPGPAQAWLPRPYPQLLRGPSHRWWRLLVSLAAGVGATVVVGLVMGVTAVLAEALSAGGVGSGPSSDAWGVTPVGFLWTNLLLASFIGVAMVAVWAGYGWRPRWVSSVAPGVRWRWLLICYLVTSPVIAINVIVLESLGGWAWSPEKDWPWLLAVVVLTTPLQAAGEEYLFRGWLFQAVGSAFADARVGALTGGLISTVLFALAHGEQNVWLWADRFAFGALACWLAWRTGGLEAGVALHGANNLLGLLVTLARGDLSDVLNAAEAPPLYLAIDVVTLLAAAGAVLLVMRRWPVQRLFVPPAPAPSSSGQGLWSSPS